MDAIMVTAEPNVSYYSGWRNFVPWWTYSRPYILVIPVIGDPVLMVQGFHHFDANRDSWIEDVRRYESLVGVPAEDVYAIFKDLNLLNKRIGMEFGHEQRIFMTYNDFEKIKAKLAGCTLVDAADVIWKQRMIKSENEIAAHRTACDIGDIVFQNIFAETKKGMTEKEVARIALRTIGAEGGEQSFCIVESGPGNYGRVAGLPTEKTLQEGDLMWIDLGVIYNGCFCDFCRAGVVGGPTDEQNAYQNKVVDLTLRTAAYVKPGLSIPELSQFCYDVAAEHGIDFSFECGRLGHGMGYNSTEPPHIALFDDTILAPGMHFTLEPGVVNDIGTFISEENLVVRPDGYELLTKTSRELRTI